jgi:hypothetical protein
MSRVIKYLGETLDPWSTMIPAKSTESLRKVLFSAVMLDLQMQQQKAYIYLGGTREFKPANNDAPYNPDTMEIRRGKPSNNRARNMELLITPILIRMGNLEGDDYASGIVLSKALVDIEVPRGK